MSRIKKPTTDIFPDKDPKGLDPYTVIVTTLNAIQKSQERLDERFDEIYDKFKEIPENYATKTELAEAKDDLRDEIATVKGGLSTIHDWFKWGTRAALVVVIGAAVTWILSGGLSP